MAKHLTSVLGTEKDGVNCQLFGSPSLGPRRSSDRYCCRSGRRHKKRHLPYADHRHGPRRSLRSRSPRRRKVRSRNPSPPLNRHPIREGGVERRVEIEEEARLSHEIDRENADH